METARVNDGYKRWTNDEYQIWKKETWAEWGKSQTCLKLAPTILVDLTILIYYIENDLIVIKM